MMNVDSIYVLIRHVEHDSIFFHNILQLYCFKWIAHSWRLFVVTLALGSQPRQKGLQGCGLRGSPRVKARRSMGVTSHTPGSVRKCEGVNPPTPKATPTFGDGVSVDS
jgi:hypothetical protein